MQITIDVNPFCKWEGALPKRTTSSLWKNGRGIGHTGLGVPRSSRWVCFKDEWKNARSAPALLFNSQRIDEFHKVTTDTEEAEAPGTFIESAPSPQGSEVLPLPAPSLQSRAAPAPVSPCKKLSPDIIVWPEGRLDPRPQTLLSLSLFLFLCPWDRLSVEEEHLKLDIQLFLHPTSSSSRSNCRCRRACWRTTPAICCPATSCKAARFRLEEGAAERGPWVVGPREQSRTPPPMTPDLLTTDRLELVSNRTSLLLPRHGLLSKRPRPPPPPTTGGRGSDTLELETASPTMLWPTLAPVNCQASLSGCWNPPPCSSRGRSR